jgi:RNA polymerase sigma-70 factor (ECF subfamily)
MDADAELMLRVSQGDAAAFRVLVERHQKSAYHFFLRLTGIVEDAEDLTQELFVAVYGASRGYRPDAPFRAYLYRIATNMALSHVRKKRLRAAVSIDGKAAEGLDIASDKHEDDPAAAFEARELRRRYEAALALLPHEWRIALELRVGRELSYREIADAMGKSVSAIESILYRAREKIAEGLERAEQGRKRT